MFFGLNIKSCVFLVNIINAVGCCYISCILVCILYYFIFNSSFVLSKCVLEFYSVSSYGFRSFVCCLIWISRSLVVGTFKCGYYYAS
jgi:hypothetical protein